jgi:hypothetical protein
LTLSEQLSNHYGDVLASFPNLVSFDNGFTGAGITTSFLTGDPFRNILNVLPLPIRTLKIVLWPRCVSFLQFIQRLELLQNLSIELMAFEGMKDCAEWNSDGQAMVLGRLSHLSVTSHHAFGQIGLLRGWKTPALRNLSWRSWKDLDWSVLEKFLETNGAQLGTLELACAWPALQRGCPVDRWCPNVEKLLIDWCEGCPTICGFPRVREIFLHTSRGYGGTFFPENTWEAGNFLEDLLLHRASWPSLEHIWDCHLYYAGNVSIGLPGFFQWKDRFIDLVESQGIRCWDSFGRRLKDAAMQPVQRYSWGEDVEVRPADAHQPRIAAPPPTVLWDMLVSGTETLGGSAPPFEPNSEHEFPCKPRMLVSWLNPCLSFYS